MENARNLGTLACYGDTRCRLKRHCLQNIFECLCEITTKINGVMRAVRRSSRYRTLILRKYIRSQGFNQIDR